MRVKTVATMVVADKGPSPLTGRKWKGPLLSIQRVKQNPTNHPVAGVSARRDHLVTLSVTAEAMPVST